MAKIRREEVIDAGLELLDEEGLDAFTTRKLAQRLGVESATLYWHVRDKAELLQAMASRAMERHHLVVAPEPGDEARGADAWSTWFAENSRSFRRALLAYRDGARLHAGTTPSESAFAKIEPKIAYLTRAGFSAGEASLALLAASQLTVGCVMEEQARLARGPETHSVDGEATFEFGLGLMLEGLRRATRVQGAPQARTTRSERSNAQRTRPLRAYVSAP